MLKKLLKYDIKSLGHTMLPIFGATILLAILTIMFQELSDLTPIFRLPKGIITILSVIMTLGIVFITYYFGIEKYYKHIVKDEGYLIHTLPVKKSQIIISKLISQILFQIVSIIVLIISLCIITRTDITEVFDAIANIFEYFTHYSITILILLISIMTITYIVSTLLIYLAISFGQKHSANKLRNSIIYGIIIFIIQQLVTSFAISPILFNKEWMTELNKTFPVEHVLNILLLSAIGIDIIISIVYFYLTKINLEKKLNLE